MKIGLCLLAQELPWGTSHKIILPFILERWQGVKNISTAQGDSPKLNRKPDGSNAKQIDPSAMPLPPDDLCSDHAAFLPTCLCNRSGS
jgi:hypothetical protein